MYPSLFKPVANGFVVADNIQVVFLRDTALPSPEVQGRDASNAGYREEGAAATVCLRGPQGALFRLTPLEPGEMNRATLTEVQGQLTPWVTAKGEALLGNPWVVNTLGEREPDAPAQPASLLRYGDLPPQAPWDCRLAIPLTKLLTHLRGGIDIPFELVSCDGQHVEKVDASLNIAGFLTFKNLSSHKNCVEPARFRRSFLALWTYLVRYGLLEECDVYRNNLVHTLFKEENMDDLAALSLPILRKDDPFRALLLATGITPVKLRPTGVSPASGQYLDDPAQTLYRFFLERAQRLANNRRAIPYFAVTPEDDSHALADVLGPLLYQFAEAWPRSYAATLHFPFPEGKLRHAVQTGFHIDLTL